MGSRGEGSSRSQAAGHNGDVPDEQEQGHQGPGFGFGVVVACLAAVILGVGAWFYLQIPPAVALSEGPVTRAPAVLDAASGVLAQQLSGAAGKTLETVADEVDQVDTPTQEQPDTVAGESAATTDYADTLAALDQAEKAAAEQLAISKHDAALAEAEQARAEAELASEEAAAARGIDDAIAAAISAAEAQSMAIPANDPAATGSTAITGDPTTTGGTPVDTGSVPTGGSIDTVGVLALVRKYFPAEEVSNAMAVSRCESGHKNAVGAVNGNGTRDYGIFQINDGGTLQAALRRINEPYANITEARQKALNAELNVRMARVLWDSRGWQPWVCAAKVKVVSGLYERTPGPMYGKYNEYGQAG